MKLTVLGCWSPYPRPGEACSGYLLQSGVTNLMLDAGNGSFAQLTRHIDFRTLTGIVVTHFHPDHYADLFCVRHAIEGARRDGTMTEPVKLYMPPAPTEVFNKLAGYTRAFTAVNIENLPPSGDIPGLETRQAKVGELDIYFVSTTHSLPCYAVLAKQNDKSLFFSGDSAPDTRLEKAAHRADLFVCESSGLDKDADQLAGIHMTAGQAGALAGRAETKQLVLTHFWPEYDTGQLQAQAEKNFGRGVELARQGKEFIIR